MNPMEIDERLRTLQGITREQFERLTARFPELEPCGLTLFLGPHYAHANPRIMMLGINPGLDQDLDPDYELQPDNCLLGDPAAPEAQRIRYWRNARRCFGTTPALRMVMEWATFSFCSPFRTPRWCQTPKPQRDAIEALSRPILERMLDDCRPATVILAGKVAVRLFARIGHVFLTEKSTPSGYGARTWTQFVGRTTWGEFDVLQVPHLSVFNSFTGLDACGLWLDHILCSSLHA